MAQNIQKFEVVNGSVHKDVTLLSSLAGTRLYPEDRGTDSPETSVRLYRSTWRRIPKDEFKEATGGGSLQNLCQPVVHDHIYN